MGCHRDGGSGGEHVGTCWGVVIKMARVRGLIGRPKVVTSYDVHEVPSPGLSNVYASRLGTCVTIVLFVIGGVNVVQLVVFVLGSVVQLFLVFSSTGLHGARVGALFFTFLWRVWSVHHHGWMLCAGFYAFTDVCT